MIKALEIITIKIVKILIIFQTIVLYNNFKLYKQNIFKNVNSFQFVDRLR